MNRLAPRRTDQLREPPDVQRGPGLWGGEAGRSVGRGGSIKPVGPIGAVGAVGPLSYPGFKPATAVYQAGAQVKPNAVYQGGAQIKLNAVASAGPGQGTSGAP